jgi:hypothetical protein
LAAQSREDPRDHKIFMSTIMRIVKAAEDGQETVVPYIPASEEVREAFVQGLQEAVKVNGRDNNEDNAATTEPATTLQRLQYRHAPMTGYDPKTGRIIIINQRCE